jgi:hypothetical protein
VKFRVALGGHDIPEDAIRRRYKGSLAHLPQVLALADEAVLVDNSEIQPRIVFQLRGGYVVGIGMIEGNPLHRLLIERCSSPCPCAADKQKRGLRQTAFLSRNCLGAIEVFTASEEAGPCKSNSTRSGLLLI